MQKEYAGTDLQEIRQFLHDEGFTEMHEDRGEKGFDLWKPDGNDYEELEQHNCPHVTVWPRAEGGYWVEEY